MNIEFNGKAITNIKEWKNTVFIGKKEKHWQPGRSAHSLADFIINRGGVQQITDMVTLIINETFVLEKGIPEYEARFDSYGHGREHDLAIWGTAKSGKKIFIGIEAKVDESFGDTIAFAYLKAKAKELNGEPTNAPQRIEKLLKFNFTHISDRDFELRYQLLFSTAGTLCVEADIHILLILVFKTNDYKKDKGTVNYKDLENFLKKADAVKTGKDIYQLTKNHKLLTLVYKEMEIDLK
jgi:hypothetical protein